MRQIDDPQFQATVDAFSRWRHSRHGVRPRISDELKVQAVHLLDRHSVRSVADALRISKNTMRIWRDHGVHPAKDQPANEMPLTAQPSDIGFIEVTPTPQSAWIDVLLPSGVILRVTAGTPTEYVGRLAAVLRCAFR